MELRDDQVIFEDEILAGVPPRELMFEHDSHFNRRGHRRLAEVVVAPLEQALRPHFDEHASLSHRPLGQSRPGMCQQL